MRFCKRMMALAIWLLLICSVADAEIQYVKNPGAWDERLNLRAAPDKDSPSLGRYYTGVRVQVLEDLGEWRRVRIAMGTSGQSQEGYMMSEYLQPFIGWGGVGYLPYAAIRETGEKVYVMAQNGDQLHVCALNGEMFFVGLEDMEGELARPADADLLLKERVATAEAGATLYAANSAGSAVIARLHGGVFISDSLLLPGREMALVGLGDEADALHGFLLPGEWTWADNGASCSAQYAVYQGSQGIVEVLGQMSDGRVILRTTKDAALTNEITLAAAFETTGLTKLSREGSYYRYEIPLPGEMSDEELIRQALVMADEALRETMLSLTPRVERWVDLQYLFSTAWVYFEDESGQTGAMAEMNSTTGHIYGWDDNG